MLLKTIGAVCVIVGCGAVGFRIAAADKYEERCLRRLLDIVSHMQWELTYRMTPLPTLCRQAVGEKGGAVSKFFLNLADELDAQLAPDVSRCCSVCLDMQKDLPPITRKILEKMGSSLGMFDLCGQVDSFHSVKKEIQRQLDLHSKNKDVRIRNYQTLGICAGAAIAILFM